ncbi:hypothetical protein B0J18DRAFT_413358 [Chaetomium sp. MPI-SDFR-AT-0129]|nr:hypothetical protein B0J18DRAFT_413358 [Chaetomium sp. MPI-SDFR-AT-0129]
MASPAEPRAAEAAMPSLQERVDKKWKEIHTKVEESSDKFDVASVTTTLGKYLEEPERKGAGKRVGTFLAIVRDVGVAVADAASLAFSPAPTCFKVIIMFIDGFEKRQQVIEGLNIVLDKSMACFKRLQTRLRNGQSDAICDIVMQQLDLFVSACEYCVKKRGYSFVRKAAEVVKLSFKDDETVKDYLRKMENLLQQESLQTGVDTYAWASGIGQQMDEAKWYKTIIKALDFDQNDLVDSGSPGKASLGRQYKPPIPGTCDWIDNHEHFKAWSASTLATGNVAAERAQLLLLEGAPGHGKTYMMARLAKTLHKLDDGSRSVAYCFGRDLLASAGSGLDAEGVRGLVVRSIVWQFAEAHKDLARSMASSIRVLQNLYGSEFFCNDSLEQWNSLLVNNEKRKKMDTVFFILIDGFESRIDDLLPLLQALENLEDNKLRVILSSLPGSEVPLTFQTVRLSEHPKDDIKTIVTFHMNSIPWLNNAGRERVKNTNDLIRDQLPTLVGGNYGKIGNFFERISRARSVDDIKRELGTVNQSYESQIKSQIQHLAETLTDDEILELNEIILWVDSGFRELTVKELEVVLRQTYPREWFSTFEERIKQVYGTILDISPAEFVTWRSPVVKDCIPEQRAGGDTHDEEQPGPLAARRAALGAEQRILEKILGLFFPSKTVGTAALETLLSARVQTYLPIRRDPLNAHLKISLACLKAFKEGPAGANEANILG